MSRWPYRTNSSILEVPVRGADFPLKPNFKVLGAERVRWNNCKEHCQHLRTTNLVESPFAALRLRTEGRFRRLNAPALMSQTYD